MYRVHIVLHGLIRVYSVQYGLYSVSHDVQCLIGYTLSYMLILICAWLRTVYLYVFCVLLGSQKSAEQQRVICEHLLNLRKLLKSAKSDKSDEIFLKFTISKQLPKSVFLPVFPHPLLLSLLLMSLVTSSHWAQVELSALTRNGSKPWQVFRHSSKAGKRNLVSVFPHGSGYIELTHIHDTLGLPNQAGMSMSIKRSIPQNVGGFGVTRPCSIKACFSVKLLEMHGGKNEVGAWGTGQGFRHW